MKTAGTTLAWHLQRAVPERLDLSEPRLRLGRSWVTSSRTRAFRGLLSLPGRTHGRRSACITGHFPYWVGERIGTRSLHSHRAARSGRTHGVGAQALQAARRAVPRPRARSDLRRRRRSRSYWIRNHQTKVFSLVPSDEARTIMRPITIDDERFETRPAQLGARRHRRASPRRSTDFLDELRQRWGWWPDGVDRTEIESTPVRRPGTCHSNFGSASPTTTRTTWRSTALHRS